MLTAGVVAEYNPFHKGHKYQLEMTRAAGATHIVSVMSGSAVQRGDIAVFSKYERASAAVRNGADLVIELPCPYSCSSGEIFAGAAVELLAGLGAVDMLSFGSECGDVLLLERGAEMSEKLKNSRAVRDYLSAGMSYPQALAKAAGERDTVFAELFGNPNDTLAVEYIKSAKKLAPDMKFLAVSRNSVGHDCGTAQGEFASASYIRSLICSDEDYGNFVPESCDGRVYSLEKLDRIMTFKIMTAEYDELAELPDMNDKLVNRFISVRETGVHSAAEFAENFKSRNITLARVRRMLIHLALGVRRSDIVPVPYGRILAFNERGREILARSENRTLLYDTSLKKLEQSSPQAQRVSHLEKNAVRLQELATELIPEFSNEYKRKITISF